MRPKIGMFQLGSVYGESEVDNLDDFEHFYYDLNDASKDILKKNKFVIIGRKGTGKTLLAHVVCRNLENDYTFSVVESLKDFDFYELTYFSASDISPTKYVPIFEWMIWMNIAKNFLKKKECFNEQQRETLSVFLKYVGVVPGELKPEKTLEITRKFQDTYLGKASVLALKAEKTTLKEESLKEVPRSYLENLETLKHFLLNIIKDSSSSFIVFYDELDDKFSNETIYKAGIISFLNAVDKVNKNLRDVNGNCKVCAVIRSDIANILRAPNVNRIIEDNSIHLNWCADLSYDTEMFDMLAHKIKRSSEYYQNKSTDDVIKSIFPDYIKDEPNKIYILHRTLGRPRDVIRMLTYIQDIYGDNLERFESNAFAKVEGKYSAYLKREIGSELAGHVNDENIELYFFLLQKIAKRSFSLIVAERLFKELDLASKGLDLHKVLSQLFISGAICNVIRQSKNEGGNRFFWSYFNEDLHVNFDLNFEIHPGLWTSLFIAQPKNRLN